MRSLPVARSCLQLLVIARMYPRVPACTRVCQRVLACTRVYPRVPACTRVYPRVPACTRVCILWLALVVWLFLGPNEKYSQWTKPWKRTWEQLWAIAWEYMQAIAGTVTGDSQKPTSYLSARSSTLKSFLELSEVGLNSIRLYPR